MNRTDLIRAAAARAQRQELRRRLARADVAHLTAYHRISGNPGRPVTYEWRPVCPLCEGPDDFAELLARHERTVR